MKWFVGKVLNPTSSVLDSWTNPLIEVFEETYQYWSQFSGKASNWYHMGQIQLFQFWASVFNMIFLKYALNYKEFLNKLGLIF